MDYVFTFILALCERIIIPAIAFVFGMMSSNFTRGKDSNKMQFENFYVPFLKSFIENQLYLYWFSDLEPEARKSVFDLLASRFCYAKLETQKLIPDFYRAWYENVTHEAEPDEVYRGPLNIDYAFNEIAQSVYKEYIALCKSLKLSPPSLPPLVELE